MFLICFKNSAFKIYFLNLIFSLFPDEKCEISLIYKDGDLNETQPIILNKSKRPSIILPATKKTLVIPFNLTIIFACPGKNNNLKAFKNNTNIIEAKCVSGKKFKVGDEEYDFSLLKCTRRSKETVRKVERKCLSRYSVYEIRFKIHDDCIVVMEICRNAAKMMTYYSKSKMPKEISHLQFLFPRPSFWSQGSFYPNLSLRVDEMYRRNRQIQSLTELVGSKDLALEYINNKKAPA